MPSEEDKGRAAAPELLFQLYKLLGRKEAAKAFVLDDGPAEAEPEGIEERISDQEADVDDSERADCGDQFLGQEEVPQRMSVASSGTGRPNPPSMSIVKMPREGAWERAVSRVSLGGSGQAYMLWYRYRTRKNPMASTASVSRMYRTGDGA